MVAVERTDLMPGGFFIGICVFWGLRAFTFLEMKTTAPGSLPHLFGAEIRASPLQLVKTIRHKLSSFQTKFSLSGPSTS